MTRNCCDCGTEIRFYHDARTVRCTPCDRARFAYMRYGTGQVQATQLVSRAIMRGLLRQATGQVCVDCGAPGEHLDHRDYNLPLDVEPVCRSCNAKRGPAKPKSWSFDEFWADFSRRKIYVYSRLTQDDFKHVRAKHWPEKQEAA